MTQLRLAEIDALGVGGIAHLLAKLLELLGDGVSGAAGVVDDVLRLLARLSNGLFPLLLDLLEVFLRLLLPLLRLQAEGFCLGAGSLHGLALLLQLV